MDAVCAWTWGDAWAYRSGGNARESPWRIWGGLVFATFSGPTFCALGLWDSHPGSFPSHRPSLACLVLKGALYSFPLRQAFLNHASIYSKMGKHGAESQWPKTAVKKPLGNARLCVLVFVFFPLLNLMTYVLYRFGKKSFRILNFREVRGQPSCRRPMAYILS